MSSRPDIHLPRVGDCLHLLHPVRCAVCFRVGAGFCRSCRATVLPAPGRACPSALQSVTSAGLHHGSLREAVLALKYARRVDLAGEFAEMAWIAMGASATGCAHLVCPVPLHWSRRISRGYNQAGLLAESIGRLLGAPLISDLVRMRATPRQVGLSALARRDNVRGAFAVRNTTRLQGARVLLIDDVWTTGATLSECAEALLRSGAAEVRAVTVSCAPEPR